MGENPLNRNGSIPSGIDIVSSSGERPEKFIRELHRLATCVKITVLPIRGKIPSAFEKSKQDFWDNAEIQGIARIILNRDYTKNFDPITDVKWEKIIFMADADVDKSNCR